VRPGARVGLLADRDEHLLPALFGILGAGAAYVPLDPSFPAERIAFMIRDAGVEVIATTSAVLERLEVPGSRRLLIDQLAGKASTGEPGAPRGGAEDLAYVIYTSGSTGTPKGVRVPHRSVVNLLSSVAREPGMTEADVVLAVTTLSFDIAVSELILPLVVGATIVLADRAEATDGDRLRAMVERDRVTFIDATPATWRLLLAAGWKGSSAVTAICTGEAMPRDLAMELAPRVKQLWNGYGPTETTVWSSFHRVERGEGPILIGGPVANTAIHVLDEELQPVPVGVIGELYIGGDGVTLGYLDRPELTAERFIADPFRVAPDARLYRTGDLGRWRVLADDHGAPHGALECRAPTSRSSCAAIASSWERSRSRWLVTPRSPSRRWSPAKIAPATSG
jgi:amino acid adenylation domain-containing protein